MFANLHLEFVNEIKGYCQIILWNYNNAFIDSTYNNYTDKDNIYGTEYKWHYFY